MDSQESAATQAAGVDDARDTVGNPQESLFKRGGPHVLEVLRIAQEKLKGPIERSIIGRIGDREYKYAGWEATVEAIRKSVTEAGGAYSFQSVMGEQHDWLRLFLFHAKTCEFLVWDEPVGRVNKVKERAAALSYAKRYLLQLAFGLPIEDEGGHDEDELGDDTPVREEAQPQRGESTADRPAQSRQPARRQQRQQRSDAPAGISDKQQEFLKVISKGRAGQLRDEGHEAVEELEPHDRVLSDLGYSRKDESENTVIRPDLIARKSFDNVVELIRKWKPSEQADGFEDKDKAPPEGANGEEPSGEEKLPE